MAIDLHKYEALLDKQYERKLGKVVKVVGLTIESIGPDAKLNDMCYIIPKNGGEAVKAEVVGFRDERVLLMPYDSVEGVGLGSRVENSGAPLKVYASDELLGKTLDGIGVPILSSIGCLENIGKILFKTASCSNLSGTARSPIASK